MFNLYNKQPNRRFFNNSSKGTGKYYHLNFRIQATELRVIDTKGELLGVMSKDEALEKARAQGLDLVLIAQNAKPPVAKITDFKKFLYQEEKKLKEAKKGAKKSDVKDIKLSLFVSDHDKERFIKRTKEFLKDGHQVRLNLTLRGREIIKKPMAIVFLNDFISKLDEVNVSKEPRVEGRVVRAVVSRKK